MDPKKIGLIALIVVGVAAAVWSFQRNFMSGPPRFGEDRASEYRQKMQESYKKTEEQMGGQPVRPAMPGVGLGARSGGPVAGSTGNR